MWRRLFRFRLVPGVMIHPRFGRIDFRRDDLDIDMLKAIVEGGSYYLELTPEGQKEFYGEKIPKEIPAIIDEAIIHLKSKSQRKSQR